MAKIVLGLATSNTPQLGIPASEWPTLLRQKDETDPRLDYQALLNGPSPALKTSSTRIGERWRNGARCSIRFGLC